MSLPNVDRSTTGVHFYFHPEGWEFLEFDDDLDGFRACRAEIEKYFDLNDQEKAEWDEWIAEKVEEWGEDEEDD